MKPVNVMINGLPGNVAKVIATHASNDERFSVVPYSLTGPEIQTRSIQINEIDFELIAPEDRERKMEAIKTQKPELICVDFTHPTAVNANAELYVRHGLPFVIGTTGGNREKLVQCIRASNVPAVVAPNMAKQIVGLQAMMTYAAENFPTLFKGYTLQVRESHQAGKADTSGTAKAMVACFNKMGVNFNPEQIQMERDPRRQHEQWGVPEAYLGGHGWHTYTLTSPDRSVKFEFTHNVNGREIYAEGTLEAVLFVARKAAQGGCGGTVFSMIDVLRSSTAS